LSRELVYAHNQTFHVAHLSANCPTHSGPLPSFPDNLSPMLLLKTGNWELGTHE
jgi:hypothetical protein